VEICGKLFELPERLFSERAIRPEGWLVSARRTAVVPMKACSTCAGDYEDPERTAWGAPADEAAETGEWPSSGAEEDGEADQERDEG